MAPPPVPSQPEPTPVPQERPAARPLRREGAIANLAESEGWGDIDPSMDDEDAQVTPTNVSTDFD